MHVGKELTCYVYVLLVYNVISYVTNSLLFFTLQAVFSAVCFVSFLFCLVIFEHLGQATTDDKKAFWQILTHLVILLLFIRKLMRDFRFWNVPESKIRMRNKEKYKRKTCL